MIDIHVIPDWPNLLAQLGSTLVLFLVIRHFVYEPMSNFLEKRKDQVMKDLDDANKAREEAELLKVQYEKQIDDARTEGLEIVEASRKRGNELKKQQEEEGRQNAEQIIEKARLQIALEREKAAQDLKLSTSEMAVLIAEKLLEQNIDATGQEKLIDQFIEELEHDHVH